VLRLDSTFEQAGGALALRLSLDALMMRQQLELSHWQRLQARGNALALARARYEDRSGRGGGAALGAGLLRSARRDMRCSACAAEEKQTLRAEVLSGNAYKKLRIDIKVRRG
jgi:hypothetical protein